MKRAGRECSESLILIRPADQVGTCRPGCRRSRRTRTNIWAPRCWKETESERCLFCHTTNFRAVLDEKGPEAKDLSIGCERCHGPGGHHIAAAEAGFADLAILNPGRMPVLAVE